MRLPVNSNYVTCCIVANAAAMSMFYMSSHCEYHLVFIMLLMLYMVLILSCVALVIHFPLWLHFQLQNTFPLKLIFLFFQREPDCLLDFVHGFIFFRNNNIF